jgi:O-acetylserine/cysteine efflux transporter
MLDETGEQAAAVGDDPIAQDTWMALTYTIFIGGIVEFGLWFWLIARCTMARVARFALLLPVFALASPLRK